MKRQRFSWPSWLWHWHQLVSAFILFFGIGMAIASLQLTPSAIPLRASSSENVMGWVWADPIGWISINDLNPSACSPGPCGTYGVNLDTGTNQINGFAWNDDAGWICFGSSCAASVSCNGTAPAGPLTAYIDAGSGTVEVHGWAKVCNEGDDGWISLNCAEPGVCAGVSPYYRVVFNPSTGYFKDTAVPGTTFAWNGTLGGTGFGYLDFQNVYVRAEAPPFCADNLDNDGNGLKDCQEVACSASANCQETPVNGNCGDGIDNNLNGPKDCQEAACHADPVCAETASNGSVCANGIDDDGDGLVDCADSGCTGYPTCVLSGEPACALGTANACCSDGTDNDSDTRVDCQDTNCQNQATICTPAWISAKFGNVYAQQGITAETTGGGQSLSNATYCLTSQGSITGFSSSSTCIESSSSQNISLPSSGTGYKGTLGSLDVNGILNGRYGTVVNFLGSLPPVLDGKVYHAVSIGGSPVTLSATTFQNGTGATQRGNGLLIVEGDLSITGDLAYQSNMLTQYLKNLASLGIIVKKKADGTGGNIFIQPSVQNIVGAYFAEDTIHTGTVGTDTPLQVLGLMAAYRFDLQRVYHDPSRAAESVIFDGRAVANPPPGMQDVSKSLPTSKEAY